MREFFLHTRGHAVLRSSAQNFLNRGEGQGIHGHTRPDGPTCALWRGRSFQSGKTRKTPAIQCRFRKCLRQPMSGANATALSHIRAWGPSAGFPTGVFPPGGLPRTRTRHRTGARLSALSWTRCDWESPPLFAFSGPGVLHVCPWGKNLARMGACGLAAFSRNFLTRGASGKETTRPRALAPAGPSVPAVSSWLRRLFRLFFAPVCALLSAGSRPALTQARRLRACPAGLSYAHGCRLGYELRRTPSADSPAVGKGGPLGPGCLLPAAAKPGGAALRR